ncbi:MAG: response regulator, partial [Bacteroidetes bacterium]
MSHEIRTPLQAIIGFTSLLAKEKLTDKQLEYVDGIDTASHNLLAIVNDILDVSKIEAGMIRLEKIPFSLTGLLHSVMQLFEPVARKRGLELHLQFEQLLPDHLLGDPTRLTQILVNLVSNAIKFTNEGKITIVVGGQRTEQQLNLSIAVKDTGIGIASERLPYIFDRFEQADNKVTRIYGGSGLGLFISRQLVELQGGHIGVSSEPGRGSTFFLEIPYTITSAEARRQLPSAKELMPIAGSFQDIKILLVEDSLMNQRVVSTFLEEWGVQYDIAENGKVAIYKLENNQYDLVLMDVQMPEMDGYSATEYIRENLNLQIPIIAMTAHAMAGEREKALSYGMNDYIAKPIRQEDFYRLIARFVPLRKINKGNSSSSEASAAASELSLPAGADPQIDYNYLMSISNGKKAYLNNILNLFIRQAPAELAKLQHALQQEDLGAVAQMAHSMKSTVGYAGLNKNLLPLLAQIEELAKAQSTTTDQLSQLVNKLEEQLRAGIERIKQEVLPMVNS